MFQQFLGLGIAWFCRIALIAPHSIFNCLLLGFRSSKLARCLVQEKPPLDLLAYISDRKRSHGGTKARESQAADLLLAASWALLFGALYLKRCV